MVPGYVWTSSLWFIVMNLCAIKELGKSLERRGLSLYSFLLYAESIAFSKEDVVFIELLNDLKSIV